MKNRCFRIRKAIVFTVVVSFLNVGFTAPVSAVIIGTGQVMQAEQRQGLLAEVDELLAREGVRQELARLGVDPAEAQQRAQSLTDAELITLSKNMDELPAGGDILAVIGAVFVVLLILEFVGVIDIFKKR